MKTIVVRLFALLIVAEWFMMPAFAQQADFFDTYLPIAKLFDSPVFFWCVVGSAVGILAIVLIFIAYTNHLEKKVYTWGQKKKIEDLVELLESPVSSESQSAFMYLRKHGGDDAEELIINKLHEQRRNGKINPYLIYLMEDLRFHSGIPVLKTINKSNSQYAQVAGESLASLLIDQRTEDNDKDKK